MTTTIPVAMSAEAYLFSISRADAEALRQLRDEVACDDNLDDLEKRDLDTAIDRRFAQLNALTLGKQTPRWK